MTKQNSLKTIDMNMALNDLCLSFCTLTDAYDLLEDYIFEERIHKNDVDSIKDKVFSMLELMRAYTQKLKQDTEDMIDIDNEKDNRIEQYERKIKELFAL